MNDETYFIYGPSRARIKQNIKKGGSITDVTYIGAHFEKKVRVGEDDELVHYIRARRARKPFDNALCRNRTTL